MTPPADVPPAFVGVDEWTSDVVAAERQDLLDEVPRHALDDLAVWSIKRLRRMGGDRRRAASRLAQKWVAADDATGEFLNALDFDEAGMLASRRAPHDDATVILRASVRDTIASYVSVLFMANLAVKPWEMQR